MVHLELPWAEARVGLPACLWLCHVWPCPWTWGPEWVPGLLCTLPGSGWQQPGPPGWGSAADGVAGARWDTGRPPVWTGPALGGAAWRWGARGGTLGVQPGGGASPCLHLQEVGVSGAEARPASRGRGLWGWWGPQPRSGKEGGMGAPRAACLVCFCYHGDRWRFGRREERRAL